MSSIGVVRQIILDTETTGMNKFGLHCEGHRVIEIGAVEIIDRNITSNKFHVYLNPNRTVDSEAFQIHGISDQFLKNKPTFSEIVNDFLNFIRNSELIMHNASFDLSFLNQELQMCNLHLKKIESCCVVIDSLKLARKKFPGQRNSLDALCERYYINNIKQRGLHSALIDAQLLANVFLAMSGGQKEMEFNNISTDLNASEKKEKLYNVKIDKAATLTVIHADKQEKLLHEKYLDCIQNNNNNCIWRK